MFRHLSGLLILAGICALPSVAGACPLTLDTNQTQLQSQIFDVALTTDPDKIAVSQLFSIELEICRKDGRPFTGNIKAGAMMPKHRHGMNYDPTVTALGGGRYKLDGFVFHMQGLWQFMFTLQEGEKSETVLLDQMLK